KLEPKKNTHVPDAGHVPPGHSESLAHVVSCLLPPRHFRGVQVASLVQRREESLLQRWSSSSPAPARAFGIGPEMLQMPHGRWLAAQLRLTVTSPSLMIGARCEMPVHPVSRIESGLVALLRKWTVDGHAHWQLVQVKPTPHAATAGGSHVSPGSRVQLPQV